VIDPADPVLVTGADPATEYVSRGGHKLAGALAAFEPRGLAVRGQRCLDAGASTGGFTDVLLRAGARQVVAVDVGYGQLAWQLRQDPRVVVLERTNARVLTPDLIGGTVELTGDPGKSLSRALSQKYLGEDPPPEPDELARVIVRVIPERVNAFSA